MIYSGLLSKVVAAAYVFQISIAHPGQTMQDLHCADILQKRGSEDRNSERIAATVAKVRADLGLPKKRVPIKTRATSPVSISHLASLWPQCHTYYAQHGRDDLLQFFLYFVT
ncbi:hypothetical protein BofuT4_P028050.1 [Botrytis cinerea T4]|uniref:Uncharacterized protein n=1 Tax=Botryotinia fuckeliana (strain T4) TaxID=999810 RepID=G2YA58_BOTF4|nr:hypothetical protein BofuT4_P028050.1 [Botrytis cinerea T4]